MNESPSAYVHFPWCVRKCPYCDFNSHPLNSALDESAYVDALIADIDQQEKEHGATNPATVFFGGGTPSLFSPDSFARLNDRLRCPGEITMEANPGTTEHADFASYRQAGINRLSLGAQTFSQAALVDLGRIHAAQDTIQAFEQARRSGFTNINLDLMYALPNQSTAEAMKDLQLAIDLQPEHISWYQLTIEPRTEFHKRPPLLPIDDEVAEIEEVGRQLLEAAGYSRYEVSAWAQPERQSAHNLNYWRFGDYYGFGAGAHGKLGRLRTDKPRQPRLYLQKPEQTNHRTLNDGDVAFEFLLNALRLKDGVPWRVFEARTQLSRTFIAEAWSRAHALDLVEADQVCTTEFGYRHLDAVLAMFLDDV